MFGHAVVGKRGIQEGIKHIPLRGPSVEDQRGKRVASYQLGVVCQEVWDPVAEGGV